MKPGEKTSKFVIRIFQRKVAPVQTEIMPQIVTHHDRYFDGFPKRLRNMFLWNNIKMIPYAFVDRLAKVFA